MYVVEVPVDGEQETPDVVRLEVREPEEGLSRVARTSGVAHRATRSMRQLVGTVRPVVESFVDTFREMEDAPSQVTVEFGLSFSAEADVVVAKGGGQAHFTVTATWGDTQ